MTNKPFFHEVSQEEVDALIEAGADWAEIMEKYSQPEWCSYPDALEAILGCWSLTDILPNGRRTCISREWCKSCDSYKEERGL